ncbi:branched-chain amino acid ABC transporter permease [Oryzicola mucosus]|uniref:Branched-chain amino acid ABC transporter permease n=1 Tax=Oryzicola mucosus TaxID=2767425 RepID=A0A8J6PVJ5_9HYPH|nr:branched-chain amino acid ABC transporter permease [Oryzicola mucosus]MBD0416759.1 branched-chain amino acid ABC transporter permease [Oryzicola mucosus]
MAFNILLQQLLNGLTIGVGYALVAGGLAAIFGIMRIVNFAHGEFFMIAGYVLYYGMSVLGLPYFAAAALAIVAVVAFGYLIQRLTIEPLMETDPLNTLLATFALSLFMFHSVVVISGSGGRTIDTPFDGVITLGNVILTEQKLLVMVAGVIFLGLLAVFLSHTPVGKQMRATAENRYAATVLGIDVKRIDRFTFGLGIALAAVAGVLIAPLTPLVPSVGTAYTLKAFAVIVLGGMGSIPGAIIAGVGLGMVEALTAGYLSSAWKDGVAFLVLITVLLTRPNGLFGQGVAH